MESLQLSDIESKAYSDLFTANDVQNCKKVSGKIASELFYKSGLPATELHKITELCGAKRLGYFGRSQFYIALRLIALAQANQPVSIEALQTKTNDLQLPRFDVVDPEKEEKITEIFQNSKGTLPPPPSKTNLKSKSVQNILSNVDPNSLKSLHSQSIPAVPSTKPSEVPETTKLHEQSYSPNSINITIEAEKEEKDENIENVEQKPQDDDNLEGHLDADESLSWTNFSDDDRGLLSTTRKEHWSKELDQDRPDNSLTDDLIEWGDSGKPADSSDGASRRRKKRLPINGAANRSSSSDVDSKSSDSSTEGGAAARRMSSSPGYDHLQNMDTDDAQVPIDEESPTEEDEEEDVEEDFDAIYAMSPDQRDYYCKCFAKMQPDSKDSLRGPTAKRFFEMSGLPVDELSLIWSLADVNQIGLLSLEEFCIAMHLIVLRKNQVPLPNKLPSVLNPVNKDAPFAADLDDEENESSLEKKESDPNSHSNENVAEDSMDYLLTEPADFSFLKMRSESLSTADPKLSLTRRESQTLKSRPRPKRSNTLPSGLLPPPLGGGVMPPVPPPRNRPAPHNPSQTLDEKAETEISSNKFDLPRPGKLSVSKQTVSLDRASPVSLASRTAESPVLNLEGMNRRTLHQKIRQEKERNHTLLRLNNELITELNEVKEQRINLNIQLKHLRPPDLE